MKSSPPIGKKKGNAYCYVCTINSNGPRWFCSLSAFSCAYKLFSDSPACLWARKASTPFSLIEPALRFDEQRYSDNLATTANNANPKKESRCLYSTPRGSSHGREGLVGCERAGASKRGEQATKKTRRSPRARTNPSTNQARHVDHLGVFPCVARQALRERQHLRRRF